MSLHLRRQPMSFRPDEPAGMTLADTRNLLVCTSGNGHFRPAQRRIVRNFASGRYEPAPPTGPFPDVTSGKGVTLKRTNDPASVAFDAVFEELVMAVFTYYCQHLCVTWTVEQCHDSFHRLMPEEQAAWRSFVLVNLRLSEKEKGACACCGSQCAAQWQFTILGDKIPQALIDAGVGICGACYLHAMEYPLMTGLPPVLHPRRIVPCSNLAQDADGSVTDGMLSFPCDSVIGTVAKHHAIVYGQLDGSKPLCRSCFRSQWCRCVWCGKERVYTSLIKAPLGLEHVCRHEKVGSSCQKQIEAALPFSHETLLERANLFLAVKQHISFQEASKRLEGKSDREKLALLVRSGVRTGKTWAELPRKNASATVWNKNGVVAKQQGRAGTRKRPSMKMTRQDQKGQLYKRSSGPVVVAAATEAVNAVMWARQCSNRSEGCKLFPYGGRYTKGTIVQPEWYVHSDDGRERVCVHCHRAHTVLGYYPSRRMIYNYKTKTYDFV